MKLMPLPGTPILPLLLSNQNLPGQIIAVSELRRDV
jgi:hypothetical protein